MEEGLWSIMQVLRQRAWLARHQGAAGSCQDWPPSLQWCAWAAARAVVPLGYLPLLPTPHAFHAARSPFTTPALPPATPAGKAIGGQTAALAIMYFVTAILSEVLTNNAAAAIMFPIAQSVAGGGGALAVGWGAWQ